MEENFRIKLKFIGCDLEPCYIYINKNKLFTISDLKVHVNELFNFKHSISLYINDIFLPDKETIKLITPSDCLIGKVYGPHENLGNLYESHDVDKEVLRNDNKYFEEISPKFVHHTEALKPKQKRTHMKRQAAEKFCPEGELNKMDTTGNNCDIISVGEQPSEQLTQIDEPCPEGFEKMELVGDNCGMVSIREQSEQLIQSEERSLIQYCSESTKPVIIGFSVPGSTKTLTNGSLVPSCCEFSKVVGSSVPSSSEPTKTITNDSISPNGQTPTKALSNGKVSEEKKASENGFIRLPVVNNIIIFKILKIGADYCPVTSDNIIGKIINVLETSDTFKVTFQILEGSQEFEEPIGKFSLDFEEGTNSTLSNITEMSWKDVLEPRLYSND